MDHPSALTSPVAMPVTQIPKNDVKRHTSAVSTSLDGYGAVERAGGSADMGCDVVATVDPSVLNGPWDHYQCKRLGHPLAPDDIWIELAKVCHYTFVGEYVLPRYYYFVASRGPGMKLLRALKKPEQLKADLFKNWAAKCAGKISKGKQVPLDPALRAYVESIDFSMFRHVPVLTLIAGHARTRYHAARFGGGLPARQRSPKPPIEIAGNEIRYRRKSQVT